VSTHIDAICGLLHRFCYSRRALISGKFSSSGKDAGHFRARLWTQYNMARMFLSNRECWMEHLSLDFITGLDPEGIRVRNAQGVDAVDFFFPGKFFSLVAVLCTASRHLLSREPQFGTDSVLGFIVQHSKGTKKLCSQHSIAESRLGSRLPINTCQYCGPDSFSLLWSSEKRSLHSCWRQLQFAICFVQVMMCGLQLSLHWRTSATTRTPSLQCHMTGD
jgi:Lecithin:cholesterol acyltransferase